MVTPMSNRLQGRPPTIRDIAREAGVSVATISRVLNRQPHVAPETREAVLRVVRERGFSQNRSARALSGAPTGLVGVTLPYIRASYFAEIAAALAEALHEQDMRPILCPTLDEHEREVGLLERLMHGTTDGAVLILPIESREELRTLSDYAYPFVVLDPRVPLDEDIPSVSAANTAGAIAAVEITRFIDLRFRPMVRVDRATIEEYYRDKLLPQLKQKSTQPAPPLREVESMIESVLVEQQIDQLLIAGLATLRNQGDIRLHPALNEPSQQGVVVP